MEIPTSFRAHPWQVLFPTRLHLPYHYIPRNYVHWIQTPEFHFYSADLPGVRKEEIKVEVEDSRYLIIRTEATDKSREPPRSFMRKFRLHGRRGFFTEPVDVPEKQLE